MKIVIDAMGGDNAPDEIVKGAALAKKELLASMILVGDEEVIRKSAEKQDISLSGITVCHAPDVITMEDSPLSIRDKSDSSMRIAFKMLKEGQADAFVGAGNTGAMHVGSTLFVHRIKGVDRSAIATIMPLERPTLLIDSGANVQVTPNFLYQFAVMGSIYMSRIYNLENPRVGLLNNGTEEKKGTQLQIDTYKLLSDSENINFVGNIEGKDIPFSKCDVLVCDGFTGNIALKTIEGMSSFILRKIKGVLSDSISGKAAGLLCGTKLKAMKRNFDASEHGGAPFLGISKPVIKAHGSSDAVAIKNAVRQAIAYYNMNIIKDIADIFADNQKKIIQ